MYVKFPLEDLNPGPYLHPASTYTCEVTIIPKVIVINKLILEILTQIQIQIR